MQRAIQRTSIGNTSPQARMSVKREREYDPTVECPAASTMSEYVVNTNKRHKKRPKRSHHVPSMTDVMSPRVAFKRVVKELLRKRSTVMQIKRNAVASLHEQTEHFLLKLKYLLLHNSPYLLLIRR